MSSLSLKKVEKIYPGGVQAIQSMNFDIKDGEFIVLVGPLRLWKINYATSDSRFRRNF